MTDTELARIRQDFLEAVAFGRVMKGWVAFRFLEVEERWLLQVEEKAATVRKLPPVGPICLVFVWPVS